VIDGFRGLQNKENDNGQPDQMLRNNLVMASRDPVAADALVAHVLGFNPWDIEFLHMAEQREGKHEPVERRCDGRRSVAIPPVMGQAEELARPRKS